MILEHCDIEIDPSKSAEFEEAIVRGVNTVIAKAKGFRGFKVNHSIESPARYLLLIYWDSLENHTVDFRGLKLLLIGALLLGHSSQNPHLLSI